ncbi:MAG: alkaline phosphatase family protein [Sandaracinaceae bacterium]|nr:alkaline phosphatase family protein [Sandaracinaceae bacterium]
MLDQLATHALERALPHLDEDGAIRRGVREGAFHRQVVYAYAGTYTAAGHAAIHTGAPPAISGIVSNEVWDRARGREVPIADDATHAVLGVEGAFVSPAALRVETVADVLERASEGARRHALALGEGPRRRLRGRAPPRPRALLRRAPARVHDLELLRALDPRVARRVAARAPRRRAPHAVGARGPRAARARARPGRRAGGGRLGRARRHVPARSSRELEALLRRARHARVQRALIALAEEAALRLEVGADEVPDLLALSISSTDYVGHVFGPDSWEYLDNLVRVDRALGAFLERLARARGPIAVLLTSDHGGAPLPERAEGESGRLVPALVASELEEALDRALGEGAWVSAFVQPFVDLSEAARAPEVRERAVAASVAHLSARREVGLAADAREAATWREDPDPVRRAVGLSVPDDAEGDVFVVPREGFVVDEGMPAGAGTSHGTPWAYDRTVPVIVWGPGVARVETREPLEQARVASTLAALLGVAPPAPAPREPLPGVSPR